MTRLFLYAHGLYSSSKSEKAQKMARWMEEGGFSVLVCDYWDITDSYYSMLDTVEGQIGTFLSMYPEDSEIWAMGASNGFGLVVRSLIRLWRISGARIFWLSPVHDLRLFLQGNPWFREKIMSEGIYNTPVILQDLNTLEQENELFPGLQKSKSIGLFVWEEDRGCLHTISDILLNLYNSKDITVWPDISVNWFVAWHDLWDVLTRQDIFKNLS